MALRQLFQRPFDASADSDIPKNVPFTLVINTLLIYLEEGTYHTRLFRGPRTNDMKNQDGPSHSWVSSVPHGCTCVSYEEEDICVPYEEEDTCVFCLSWVSAVSARVCARLSV